jgi:UMP-CMP kinase
LGAEIKCFRQELKSFPSPFFIRRFRIMAGTLTPPRGSETDGIKPTIIGILGGPGSGKGTQCRLMCESFEMEHLSIGDVLRDEIDRRDSPYASIIKENMLAGTVGPKEITISLLHSRMTESIKNETTIFVLDGRFPLHTLTVDMLNYVGQSRIP